MAFYAVFQSKTDMVLRAAFSSNEAEDADGLTLAEDDNKAWWNICRKDCLIIMGEQHQDKRVVSKLMANFIFSIVHCCKIK